jgi:hypothetical protein
LGWARPRPDGKQSDGLHLWEDRGSWPLLPARLWCRRLLPASR